MEIQDTANGADSSSHHSEHGRWEGRPRTRVVLIGGGVRSGKSRLGEARTLELAGPCGTRPTYIATAECHDAEMRERVARHREDRGDRFRTLEVPTDLVGTLQALNAAPTDASADRTPAVLVECLTLWLSNLLVAGSTDAELEAACDALLTVLADLSIPVVLITNEVGLGIVPEHALARRFRDAAGRLHQRLSSVSDEVFFCALGTPLRLKPGPVEAVATPVGSPTYPSSPS